MEFEKLFSGQPYIRTFKKSFDFAGANDVFWIKKHQTIVQKMSSQNLIFELIYINKGLRNFLLPFGYMRVTRETKQKEVDKLC